MAVHVTYDTIGDVYAIDLVPAPVARTVEFDDAHLVDLADDGSVVSIEVLDPDRARLNEIAAQFGLEDQLPEIEEAVRNSVPPVTRPRDLFISYSFTTATRYAPTVVKIASGKSLATAPSREVALAMEAAAGHHH